MHPWGKRPPGPLQGLSWGPPAPSRVLTAPFWDGSCLPAEGDGVGEPRSSPCLGSSCRPAPAPGPGSQPGGPAQPLPLCLSRRARAGCSLGQRMAALPGAFCPSSEGPGTAQRVTGLRRKGSAPGVDPTGSSQRGPGWGEPPRTPKAAGARWRGADADRDPSDSLDPACLLPTDQGSANRQSDRQGWGRGAGRQGGHGVRRLGCGPALGGTSRAVASAHPWGSMFEAREPQGDGERTQASGSAELTLVIWEQGGPSRPRGTRAKQTRGPAAPGFPSPPSREALAQDPPRRTAGVHDAVRPPHPEPGGAL